MPKSKKQAAVKAGKLISKRCINWNWRLLRMVI